MTGVQTCALPISGGVPFIGFGFQFGPTDADFAWAAGVLSTYPDRLAIVSTHAYIDNSNGYDDDALNYVQTGDVNSGQQMWDEFVSLYPQIVLVVNGHEIAGDMQGRKVDYVGGEPINQVLSNYQIGRAHV